MKVVVLYADRQMAAVAGDTTGADMFRTVSRPASSTRPKIRTHDLYETSVSETPVHSLLVDGICLFSQPVCRHTRYGIQSASSSLSTSFGLTISQAFLMSPYREHIYLLIYIVSFLLTSSFFIFYFFFLEEFTSSQDVHMEGHTSLYTMIDASAVVMYWF